MLSRGSKVLLIANPVAQNGAGAKAAKRAAALLRASLSEGSLDVMLTQAPGHAEAEASGAGDYGAVIALGGDGIIHETANGLLRLPAEDRPVFGIVPVGSGNDYARTLGMSARSVDAAVSQLLSARPQWFDVGLANGRYFVETLSFGLDAAIALDTVDRRARTGKTGTMLYLESGIEQLLHHLDLHHYRAKLSGEGMRSAASAMRMLEGDSLSFRGADRPNLWRRLPHLPRGAHRRRHARFVHSAPAAWASLRHVYFPFGEKRAPHALQADRVSASALPQARFRRSACRADRRRALRSRRIRHSLRSPCASGAGAVKVSGCMQLAARSSDRSPQPAHRRRFACESVRPFAAPSPQLAPLPHVFRLWGLLFEKIVACHYELGRI